MPNFGDVPQTIPLIGQKYKVHSGVAVVMIECNCGSRRHLQLSGIPGAAVAAVCRECGRGYALKAVAIDMVAGQIQTVIQDYSPQAVAQQASPEQPPPQGTS